MREDVARMRNVACSKDPRDVRIRFSAVSLPPPAVNRKGIVRTKRSSLPVVGLQIFNGQRVDVGPRRVKQPPRKRIKDRRLILPGDLHRMRLPDNVAGQYNRVRTPGLVVFRGRAQLHPLGFLAVRADHAYDEHPDFPAVRQTLVRLWDIYRQLVMGLCNFHDTPIISVSFMKANGFRL